MSDTLVRDVLYGPSIKPLAPTKDTKIKNGEHDASKPAPAPEDAPPLPAEQVAARLIAPQFQVPDEDRESSGTVADSLSSDKLMAAISAERTIQKDSKKRMTRLLQQLMDRATNAD